MYKAVVVGTDGTARAAVAVEHAATLARATGATLHLVHAYRLPSATVIATPELGAVAAGSDADATSAAQSLVDDVAERLRADGVAEVSAHARPGGAADALCRVADDVGADVVVVGNKGMAGARRLLGSVPNAVAHHATCAVLIVPTT
jgi:nucleotide-binding universal stress UspA family protein